MFIELNAIKDSKGISLESSSCYNYPFGVSKFHSYAWETSVKDTKERYIGERAQVAQLQFANIDITVVWKGNPSRRATSARTLSRADAFAKKLVRRTKHEKTSSPHLPPGSSSEAFQTFCELLCLRGHGPATTKKKKKEKEKEKKKENNVTGENERRRTTVKGEQKLPLIWIQPSRNILRLINERISSLGSCFEPALSSPFNGENRRLEISSLVLSSSITW